MADDAALFDFYDRRIPKDVTSARHFDTWWKKARAESPDLLTFTPADLEARPPARSGPPTIPAAGTSFRCRTSSLPASGTTG